MRPDLQLGRLLLLAMLQAAAYWVTPVPDSGMKAVAEIRL